MWRVESEGAAVFYVSQAIIDTSFETGLLWLVVYDRHDKLE